MQWVKKNENFGIKILFANRIFWD